MLEVVLHVGLGTFLPVRTPDLNQHKMHEEEVYISSKTLEVLERVKKEGGAIWTLGTTVMRALESWKKGFFQETERGVSGWTDLFITPGFEFQVGDYLLTNFHQPRSTLLALVMAFAGKDKVKRAYQWAIQKEFRLFSYGDLSVWKR
ncbi:MAG: hypothetical protein D6797_05715 [Bdellovibrio sp.]|nr:MAG: hypothetical protein D6797_05715 [Bdellovibrio sp.]